MSRAPGSRPGFVARAKPEGKAIWGFDYLRALRRDNRLLIPPEADFEVNFLSPEGELIEGGGGGSGLNDRDRAS